MQGTQGDAVTWTDWTLSARSNAGQYAEDPVPGQLRLVKNAVSPDGVHAAELIELIHPDQLPQIARADLAGSITRAVCTSWSDFESLGIVDTLRRDVLDLGHRLHLLLHRSVLAAPASDPRLNQLGALGAEVRVTSWSLPNMVVLGTEVIAATAAAGLQVARVRSRELGTILLHLFGALWDHAQDFASARRAAAIQKDPIRSAVLAHLCAGVLDDTAARAMDVSVRTYRRYVAGILSDLTVTSRFQAGVKAADLGLLGGLRATSG
jgi:DNA-binding NarL/FixJ family response regulator